MHSTRSTLTAIIVVTLLATAAGSARTHAQQPRARDTLPHARTDTEESALIDIRQLSLRDTVHAVYAKAAEKANTAPARNGSDTAVQDTSASTQTMQQYESLFSAGGTGDGKDTAGAETTYHLSLTGTHDVRLRLPLAPAHHGYASALRAPCVQSRLLLEGGTDRVTFTFGTHVDYYVCHDSCTGAKPPVSSVNGPHPIGLRPDAAMVSVMAGDMTVGMGLQYLSWGSADRINPTDNVNAIDYTRGPDGEKLPAFALTADYFPRAWLGIHGVFIPYRQPDEFPIDVAATIPDTLFARIALTSLSFDVNTFAPEYEYTLHMSEPVIEKKYPAFAPGSFIAGGRLSLFSGPVDVSASYLYEYATYWSPAVTMQRYSTLTDSTTVVGLDLPLPDMLTGMFDAWSVSRLTLEKSRVHRFGVDAKTIAGKTGIWAEICYSRTADRDPQAYARRKDDIAWTTGLDFSYGENSRHYCNVQHTGVYVLDYDDSFYADYPDGLPHPDSIGQRAYMHRYFYRALTQPLSMQNQRLHTGASIKLEWGFPDRDLTPSVEGLFLYPFGYDDTRIRRYGDLTGTLQLQYRVNDNALLTTGLEGFYSFMTHHNAGGFENNPDTRLGAYYPDSRLFCTLQYSWTTD